MRRRGEMRSAVAGMAVAAFAFVGGACRREEPASESRKVDTPRTTQGSSALWAYPQERWDDPELVSQPRLQFVWRAPDEERDSIFSVRLDGTDIRRVAGPELLYSGEAKWLSQTPVRSPDRRYIACVGDDADREQLRFLVDLKTSTVRSMMKTYGAVHFNWTPDSRHVLFYGDIKLWDFDVETGKVTQLPMIYSSGLHLVEDGRHFVAIRDSAIERYDRSGRKLRTVPLPFKTSDHHALSADGRLVAFNLGSELLIISTDKPDQPLFRGAESLLFSAFAPDGSILYYFSGNDLKALHVASGRVDDLTKLPQRVPAQMTLVGGRSVR
jgi:hypothetical protein